MGSAAATKFSAEPTTLAPSDFAFLWEECKRCFYLKVVRREHRPRTPMPTIFIHIDGLCKRYFDGLGTAVLSPALPRGTIRAAEGLRVRSEVLTIPGHTRPVALRGNLDGYIAFEGGGFGLVDFKTSQASESHIPLYRRQLHAYAWALEHPAADALALGPISRLGLLCLDPTDIFVLPDGGEAFRIQKTWIECGRDDAAFFDFVDQVLRVLELPEPPAPAPRCAHCRYRGVGAAQ